MLCVFYVIQCANVQKSKIKYKFCNTFLISTHENPRIYLIRQLGNLKKGIINEEKPDFSYLHFLSLILR